MTVFTFSNTIFKIKKKTFMHFRKGIVNTIMYKLTNWTFIRFTGE